MNTPTANALDAKTQAFLSDLEADLWKAADKLRAELDAANYKHIVLGLIFLKYITDSFTAQRERIESELQDPASPYHLDPADYPGTYKEAIAAELEERDYYTKDNIFWVPQQARWDKIAAAATLELGAELPWGGKYGAFDAIEKDNPRLKGVLQRISDYGVSNATLIGLIQLFSKNSFHAHGALSAKDILGHVYEYFLGRFALAEGKRGGQYFTPKAIVSLIVAMLEPYHGRVYDPAMGSGGFFVQTERFIRAHQGDSGAISIYGQEKNRTTWKLAAMNMAIRGIEYNFGKGPADSFTAPQHIDQKMDYVMANPPFNADEWWSEALAGDPRWQYGTPPAGNANYAWLQHMLHHLAPSGRMALLLANGSMSSQSSGEGDIRRALIEADLVEAMIALPGQLFTNTQIPACIWILHKAKPRRGETLFIDARALGYMKDRAQRDLTDTDIARIATTYHRWQQADDYHDEPAYSYAAKTAEIARNDYVLTPGRYVGTAETEEDSEPFAEKMTRLTALLNEQFKQGAELEAQIKANLGEMGYE
ncbi:type I restriction-modification system subunit M [Cardiobacterium hominis]|uniref:class I SAM-dependent DNA methyltransferase n=1 Tax=Cardiobacterium hominis TaxID=2718 RepID=UPI00249305B8|nr:class I SAM-dependent DNA methyltransferase [Cardiobacterium hominis]